MNTDWLDRIECKVSKKVKCIFRFWNLAERESSLGNLSSRQIGNVVVNLVNEVKHFKLHDCCLYPLVCSKARQRVLNKSSIFVESTFDVFEC